MFYGDGDSFRYWLNRRQNGDYDEYFLEELESIAAQHSYTIESVIGYEPVKWGKGELSYDEWEKDLPDDKYESYDDEDETYEEREDETHEESEESQSGEEVKVCQRSVT
jgi:hypothetical protein